MAVGAADTAAALFAAGPRPDEAMLNLGAGGQWAVPESEFRPVGGTSLYRAVGGGSRNPAWRALLEEPSAFRSARP